MGSLVLDSMVLKRSPFQQERNLEVLQSATETDRDRDLPKATQ